MSLPVCTPVAAGTAPAAAAPLRPAQRMPQRPLRVLVFSSLFPSEARPRHGIFVETRLAHLMRDCAVDARVVAPVPWFPSSSPRFGAYAAFAATPRRAVRANGLAVSYPRYAMLPKIGTALQPSSMARAAWADIAAWRRDGWQPDLIDAHYLYPDGVAACMLARRLGVPFVMTARGTDVNVIARMPGPGRRIADAAAQAAAVIAVSEPLRHGLLALGVDAAKLHMLRNGVDTDVFCPEDRAVARARAALPLAPPLLAVVGNLLPEKGQALAVEALTQLPGVHLVIVGEGPERPALLALAQRLPVHDRVHWRASMPQVQLRDVYAAADALLLTSSREGWPNVVLESMACGTPVVATDVGAVRQMIVGPEFGRIVTERSAAAIAAAAAAQLARPASREALQRHAAHHDWASISRAQWDLFTRAVA